MDFEIRKAVKEDLNRINKLTAQMHNYFGGLVGVKLNDKKLEHENFNEGDLKEIIFVAVVGNDIVGYISFSPKPKQEEINGKYITVGHLAVDEKFQRHGIGAAPMKKILEHAKQKNLNVIADTGFHNKKALDFYRGLGFKELGVRLIIDNQKRLKI